MKVRHILATKVGGVITITPQDSVKTAVSRLAEHNIGVLLVVAEDGKLIGIISERDIVRQAAADNNVLTLSVAEVMTHDVKVGLPQDDLMAVANTMTDGRFRHLPIVDNDELIGIISIGDVIKIQRDVFRGEIDTLETQLLQEDES
ncbi:MAG: CBS domain-containing protein [Anaerolineales bacterium]|nr:CBS domain-containing protein [Anaerolineales bacterium]